MATETYSLRVEAAQAVTYWIAERHGSEIANAWAWNCTPYPFGLPDDETLEQGLSLALGEITLYQLMAKVEEEMSRAMAELRANEERQSDGL